MAILAGISGHARNATVAVVQDGVLLGVCEEGRVIRVRDIGVDAGGAPEEALALLLRAGGLGPDAVSERVVAEPALADASSDPTRLLDHHFAHAATAFLTAPFDAAAVVVCDTDSVRPVSAWIGTGTSLERVDLEWRGPGPAVLYSRLVERLGLQPGTDEYLVEALSRLDDGQSAARVRELLEWADGGARVDPGLDGWVAATAASAGTPETLGRTAGAVQGRIGELLVEFLAGVRRLTGASRLCCGGGLFFNTYLNSVVRQSGLFDETFVPIHPGNGGLAVGCALARAIEIGERREHGPAASCFLGPAYSHEEIKAVLDNCKLAYDFVDDSSLVGLTVDALSRGELVGWFRGRMEWGTRALGNRSIFASPFSPYVLDNLNGFLKHRRTYRGYGLAVCDEQVSELFEGPVGSPFMECEYRPREPERFAHILPAGVSTTRVQTVGLEPPLLRELIQAFGEAQGTPALVNTSFNGFHEPIVCSPRDGVRVFFGSGLDMLALGNFVLRK